jgi:hypothetical protein
MPADLFPGETPGSIETKSDPSDHYNCVGWVLTGKKKDNFIWPDPDVQHQWPENFARDERIETFAAFAKSIGFVLCDSLEAEGSYLKIAIYGDENNSLSHVARQLRATHHRGWWTSKLGSGVDVHHRDPFVLENWSNGKFRFVMIFRSPQSFPILPPLHPPLPRLITPSGAPLLR